MVLVMVGEEDEASHGREEREGAEGEVFCRQPCCLVRQTCGER